jgi:serine/threonine protein kinase
MERKLGPYEIQKRLAVGGLAEIFLGRKAGMLGFEQRYALKVLLPQYAESEEHRKLMIDEARLTARLDHPNIIKVHDLISDDGTLVMVMEYINGMDLSRLLDDLRRLGQRMPIPAALWIAQEMCAGLHYAHTRTDTEGNHLRIVHRDVSPQNVLIGYGGEAKLIDFGVAKAAGVGRLETKTGIIKGKLAYMAPEYAVGSQQDPRSDVFAAGLCLFEMVSGRPAYDIAEPKKLIEVVKQASIPAPGTLRDGVPPELDAIVAKATERNPDDRFATAQEFQRTLASLHARFASDFNRERFAGWLDALRRKMTALAGEAPQNSSPSADTPAARSGEVGPTSSANRPTDDLPPDDFADDDFAELETMAMENPLLKKPGDSDRSESDEIAVATTGPMEMADPADYRPEDTAGPDEETIDPDRVPDSGDDLARLPTADLDLSNIDPSRSRDGGDTEILPADQATVTNIDVRRIRGDRKEGDERRPQILSPSGFQEFLSGEELRKVRDDSAETLPGEPPDESTTAPTHALNPAEPTGSGPKPSPSERSAPETAAGESGSQTTATPDVGAGPGSHGPADSWDMPEPPPEKAESMGRTAEGLARKVGSKYGKYSQTEKGRRTVHAAIVALLAILFVGLLMYVFFFAD